jgi:hypothetical protein
MLRPSLPGTVEPRSTLNDLDVVDVPLIDQDVGLNTTSPLLQHRHVFPHIAPGFRRHGHLDRPAFLFERACQPLRPNRRPVPNAEAPRDRVTDHHQPLYAGTPRPGVEAAPLFVLDVEVLERMAPRPAKCRLALIAIDHPQNRFATCEENHRRDEQTENRAEQPLEDQVTEFYLLSFGLMLTLRSQP